MGRLESPTFDLVVIFGIVYLVQEVAGLFGFGISWFALAAPFVRPWTLITNVYAHASIGHLLTNAVALALVGFGLERYTTRLRLHGFVLVTGAIAASVELLVGTALGRSVAVVGASGAILALYGYVIAGNRITDGVFSRVTLSRRTKVVLVATAALVVTILTADRGVALIAHATGFVLGLLGGRIGLLRVD